MRIMTRENFITRLMKEMHMLRPEYPVRLTTVTKNGVDHEALVYDMSAAESDGQDYEVSPCIYINPLYQAYLDGVKFYVIADRLRRMVFAKPPAINFPLDMYDQMKDNLMIRVQGIDYGGASVLSLPHTRVEDLVITYHVFIRDADSEGFYVATINDSLFSELGVTMEQLHDDAVASSARSFPPQRMSLNDVAASSMLEFLNANGESEEAISEALYEFDRNHVPMYILTNKQCTKGAAVMFYRDELRKQALELGASSLLIIPSSLDEVILIPDALTEADHFRQVVRDVNLKEVEPEDRLSNSIYGYTLDNDRFFRIGAGSTAC